MEANALKEQQAHSPGQSEATPWVVGTYKKTPCKGKSIKSVVMTTNKYIYGTVIM